jgi:hypothetical protein
MIIRRYNCLKCKAVFDCEQWEKKAQFTVCTPEHCPSEPCGQGSLKSKLVRGEEDEWLDRTPYFVSSVVHILREDSRLRWGFLLGLFAVFLAMIMTARLIPQAESSIVDDVPKISAISLLRANWCRRQAASFIQEGRTNEAVASVIRSLSINRGDRESSRYLLRILAEGRQFHPGWVRLGIAQADLIMSFADRTPADVDLVSRFYAQTDLIGLAYSGGRRLIVNVVRDEVDESRQRASTERRVVRAIKERFTEETPELPLEMGLHLYRAFFECGLRERFERLWDRKVPGLNEESLAKLYRWGWDAMSSNSTRSASSLSRLQEFAGDEVNVHSLEANHILVRVFHARQDTSGMEESLARLAKAGADTLTDRLLLVRLLASKREVERATSAYENIVGTPQTVIEAVLQLKACHDLGRNEQLAELLDSFLTDFNYSPELCLEGARVLYDARLAPELTNLGVRIRELNDHDQSVRDYGFFAMGLAELLRGNRVSGGNLFERFALSGGLDSTVAPEVMNQLTSLGFSRLAATVAERSREHSDSVLENIAGRKTPKTSQLPVGGGTSKGIRNESSTQRQPDAVILPSGPLQAGSGSQ